MNALVSIDIETLTPATVFAPGGIEALVSKLEAEVRAIPQEIETPEGREAIRSLAYKVARSKTALDDMGKELVAGIKKQAGLIDADRRIARDRLDALRDEVRGPLTDWENVEAARVDEHERALVWLATAHHFAAPPTADQIEERISLVDHLLTRNFEEFEERATAGIYEARAILKPMLEQADQAERDRAELDDLRRQKAERDAADRAAAEAAAKAARDAQEAEQAAAREHQRAAQAKRDQEAAAARAVEQERQRVAAVAAAEAAAAAKREASKKHRAKVHNEIARALIHLAGANAAPDILEATEEIVAAIAAGKIPHVSVTY